MDTSHIETTYRRLRAQFEAGELSEAGFKAQLHDLMAEDEQGRWWMIGYETGQWYVHDGETWVPAEPPRPVPPPPPPPPVEEVVAVPLAVAAAPKTRPWLGLLIIIAAWGAGFGITVVSEPYDVALKTGGMALAGLGTGIGLWLMEPAVRWSYVVVATVAWGLVGLGLAARNFDKYWLRETVALMALGLVWLGGGLVMGLLLKRAVAAARWYRVLIVALGWAVAALGPLLVLYVLDIWLEYLAIAMMVGAVIGAIGGLATLWQVRQAQGDVVRQQRVTPA